MSRDTSSIAQPALAATQWREPAPTASRPRKREADNVYDWIRHSPLVGSGINLDRPRDYTGRKLDLF